AARHFSQKKISMHTAITAWVLFLVVLIGLPLLNSEVKNHYLDLFDSFYQTGALVFGGGHVVLPLLQSQLVQTGLIDNTTFLTGYGLAQATPGPLFSVAAFLGTSIGGADYGWLVGLMCVVAIYLPSILILIGILPVWDTWRHYLGFQTVLAGVSAAVVGLLIAAFYHPVWSESIQSYLDIGIVLLAFILLQRYQWPQWLIVLLCVGITFTNLLP
ncbi:MAG: chromate transporter, partial [Gammaproteobacteria bacterium]